MLLLPNEQQIDFPFSQNIILTDKRLHYEDKVWGKTYSCTLFHEHISSIEKKYTSYPLLLILSLIITLFGIAIVISNGIEVNPEPLVYLIIIFGFLVLLIWWLTKKRSIKITSFSGVAINVLVNRKSVSEIDQMLFEIQNAINKRMYP